MQDPARLIVRVDLMHNRNLGLMDLKLGLEHARLFKQ